MLVDLVTSFLVEQVNEKALGSTGGKKGHSVKNADTVGCGVQGKMGSPFPEYSASLEYFTQICLI